MRFWDASALVPLLRPEPRTGDVRALHQQDGEITVWWGARLECLSALSRLVRDRRLDEAGAAQAGARLTALLEAADEIVPTNDLRDRAERLLSIHPLTAADALQLAAALIWARERPSHRGFVCLDEQLRRAAGREGFAVLPADRQLL